MNKLQSSALLIAMVLGVVLTMVVVGIATTMKQHSDLSGQARDGKIAYRAALSGIEDGLLRYNYARARGKEGEIFRSYPKIDISFPPRVPLASYELEIGIEALSVARDANDDFEYMPNEENGGRKMQVDDVIDINLFPYTDRLDSLIIHFSQPYVEDNFANEYYTAMNYRLIDVKKEGEYQLVKEDTFLCKNLCPDPRNNCLDCQVSTEKLSMCTYELSSECHLRIRPLVSVANSWLNQEARRLKGNEDSSEGGKYIYYKIEARDKGGELLGLAGEDDQPGIIKIISIGYAGEAVRKLEAKIDASTGNYLGLFDFGIYCGRECIWPS